MFDHYCLFCQNLANIGDVSEACDGCKWGFDFKRGIEICVPTKFVPNLQWKNKNKEENKMIITIVGSLKDIDTMTDVKKFFERFGHEVNCPGEKEIQEMSLFSIQSLWIEKIEEADLIVAIPKNLKLVDNGSSDIVMTFGESTSYEMSIALSKNKRIIFWN